MRFVLCIVIAALLPASALAATDGVAMSLSSAQAAAAKGDQKAAAAVQTTTSREACMSESVPPKRRTRSISAGSRVGNIWWRRVSMIDGVGTDMVLLTGLFPVRPGYTFLGLRET